MPSGRELAEAIGIHQATTARAVAAQIRKCLVAHEDRALELADPQARAREGTSALFASVRTDGAKADAHTEVAQQLEHKIDRLLRRLGRVEDAPDAARDLAPPEVERCYRFALNETRRLQDSCRHTKAVIGKALADQEQRQGEQFQTVATALASIILIPTLIAGIFGASVHVPAENSSFGFPALVGVILILTAISYLALRKAQRLDWVGSWRAFIPEIGGAAIVLAAYVAFLVAI
jgi:hypothetical protein